jgi:hypothetical protein
MMHAMRMRSFGLALLLAGSGAVLAACGGGNARSRSAEVPADTSSDAAATGWVRLPVTPAAFATGVPTPTPVDPATVPDCAANDLALGQPYFQGAGGWATGGVTFTNTGARPCALSAPRHVSMLDSSGALVASGSVAAQTRIVLPPNVPPADHPTAGQAGLWLLWYAREDTPANSCGPRSPSLLAFAVTLSDGATLVSPSYTGLPPCDAAFRAEGFLPGG